MPTHSPPNAEHVRNVVEERLRALEDQGGVTETTSVEWRGEQRHLPVISMPVELLMYNPGTHRVRAQRTLDPVRDRVLEDAPYSSDAQAYLHQLLMGDPTDPSSVDSSFENLKEDLRTHGQNDPGVITRSGVLINGNTRRAAMKELGHEHIRVGVLPPDASLDDIRGVELALQLRREHKRDYSFMNLLLAIDERVSAGRPATEIQRDFRMKASTFERCRWILDFVRDAIKRSQVNVDGTSVGLRLIEFERHQGKLEELYRSYMSLKVTAPEDADALREQRMLGIVMEKSKTDVRYIEPDFVERYMKSALPEVPADPSPARTIPGTGLKAAGPSRKVVALRALTDTALQARAVSLAGDKVPAETLSAHDSVLAKLDAALDRGLNQAGKQGRVLKRRYAPVDRLVDVNDALDLLLESVAAARSTNDFASDDLDEGLAGLRSRMVKLARLVCRADPEEPQGDGLSWLEGVAKSTPAGS